jgi:hypothetical protein
MFFLSEKRVLLPPQGEGWDGGGFTSRVILLGTLKKFCVFPWVSVVKTVFEMTSSSSFLFRWRDERLHPRS